MLPVCRLQKERCQLGQGGSRGGGGMALGVCRWVASAEASPLLVDSHRYFYKVTASLWPARIPRADGRLRGRRPPRIAGSPAWEGG